MAEWREYEVQISRRFKSYYPNCRITHNVKKLGRHSKSPRQIDVLIETEIAQFEIFGVIECKYLKTAVDIPIVDRFVGFLEDVGADFGYLVTNVGFSQAARNRANSVNIYLQIIEFTRLGEYQFDLDDVINEKIESLKCDETIFLMRQEQRSRYVDLEFTSLEEKVLTFKAGFVRSEYFAYKKLLEESARIFRDFPCIERVKIIVPLDNEQYTCQMEIDSYEKFLGVSFLELRRDIKNWREFLGSIKKSFVKDFASIFVEKSPYK